MLQNYINVQRYSYQLGACTHQRVQAAWLLAGRLLFFHQISHLLLGFIGVPGAQEKCSANSGELDTDPRTRNSGELCTSVIINSWWSSGGMFAHHDCTMECSRQCKNTTQAIRL